MNSNDQAISRDNLKKAIAALQQDGQEGLQDFLGRLYPGTKPSPTGEASTDSTSEPKKKED